MAKKKAGRPKKKNPLGDALRVRLLPEVVEAIEEYRKQHSLMNLAEAARRAIGEEMRRSGHLK